MRELSGEHIAALLATAIACGLVAAGARRLGERFAVPVARGLALVIATAYATEQLTNVVRGTWTARFDLPLQLSDAVTFVAIAALLHRRKGMLVELLYFWSLSGSLQAVLTPDLDQGFPDVLYFTYFGTHSGALTATSLLVFGCRLVPRPGAARRIYAATVAFAAVAALGTIATGGNYMFLRHKPVHPSLLDEMGPWPWYIATAAAVALVMFLALDGLAWAMRPRPRDDRRRRLRSAPRSAGRPPWRLL